MLLKLVPVLYNLHTLILLNDLLCGLVVKISLLQGYRTEKYCVSCEVQTEFIYVM
jgi:hypothetical protein